MLLWQRICNANFSNLLLTNIYREGSEVWWLKLITWIFLCLHDLPAPLSIPSLAWTGDLSKVCSGHLWQLSANLTNSYSIEEDIAAFIVDLLQNHLIPGMVAGTSTQKSQYCK